MTPHVQSHSGLMVPLQAPQPHHIRLGDIAHALARIPRFNGATTQPWSVADHSLLVVDLMPAGLPPDIYLAGLLHDAHEAYIGDITSPVAAAIRGTRDACPIDDLKVLFDVAITAALALPAGRLQHPTIAEADRLALAIERELLMAPSDQPWPGLVKLRVLPTLKVRCSVLSGQAFARRAIKLFGAQHHINGMVFVGAT